MPQVRKLNDEEVRAIERKTLGTRKATEIEYDRYLADFGPGDYGEVELQPSDNRLTVRNRLKAAASRHNPPLALAFQRTRGSTLRFSVEVAEAVAPPSEPPAAPAGEPQAAAPARRRSRAGGRAEPENGAAEPRPRRKRKTPEE